MRRLDIWQGHNNNDKEQKTQSICDIKRVQLLIVGLMVKSLNFPPHQCVYTKPWSQNIQMWRERKKINVILMCKQRLNTFSCENTLGTPQ